MAVTEWFRTPNIWPILRDHVTSLDHAATIWTSACATGEEAFSVAIMLHRAGLDGHIIATDIDRKLVRAAAKGHYRAVPPTLTQYFAVAGRTHIVRPHIAERVTFSVAELGDDPVPACDLAFARNVWRHLSRTAQDRAAQHIAYAIGARGRLILGGADFYDEEQRDTLPNAIANLFEEAEHPLIWRRKHKMSDPPPKGVQITDPPARTPASLPRDLRAQLVTKIPERTNHLR